MRALGPGSVSSFLKIILDVVYVALWIGVSVMGVLMLLALLFAFNPDLLADLVVTAGGEEVENRGPVMTLGLLAATAYMGGVLVIVAQLRKIFATLTAGDPFHPDNVRRLRMVGLILAGLELGRYAFWVLSRAILPDANAVEPSLSLTAWFSVLVVFVLAEVFREGARLRREAELTI